MKANHLKRWAALILFQALASFCAPQAWATLVTLSGANDVLKGSAIRSNFSPRDFPAQALSPGSTAVAPMQAPSDPLTPFDQHPPMAGAGTVNSLLSFIEEKVLGPLTGTDVIPDHAWLIGVGLIGLVSIRGWKRPNQTRTISRNQAM